MKSSFSILGGIALVTLRSGWRHMLIGTVLVALLLGGIGWVASEDSTWQRAVDQMRAQIERDRQQEREAPRPDLTGQVVRVEGTGPGVTALRQSLQQMGARVQATGEPRTDADVVVRAQGRSTDTYYWQVTPTSYGQDIDEALAWASQQQRDAWLAQRPDARLDHARVIPDARGRYASMRLILSGSLLLLSAYLLVMFSGSMIGVEWDMDRTGGRLEPWTLVPSPLWCLYGGQALGGALLALGAMLTLVTVAKLVGLGMTWMVGFSLATLVACTTIFVGVYGVFGTMLFRHRFGRTFARLLLAPLNMLLVAGYAWLRMHHNPQWWMALAQGSGNNEAAIGLMLGAGAILLALSIGLLPLIEWRIGARRQGLRRL